MTFIGTHGMIHVDRDKLISMPAEILKLPLEKKDVHLPRAKSHQDDWLECLRTRKDPIANVEVGARSVTVCHLGNLVYWHRQALDWDPLAWQFKNNTGTYSEAWKSGGATGFTVKSMIDRERRDPWQLPTI